MQEALARGGIATVDVNGVYVAAYLPASPMPVTHPDVLALTLEARDRENSYRMTVDEFAQALNDLGWPFRPNPSPGEQLIDFLADWISAAGESSSDPQSFTPLFLAEMARRQIPAVDLSSGEADPSQARLSLLELQLFSAAFDRIMIFPQTSILPNPSGAHLASLRPMNMESPLAQDDPCSKYKKIFYGPLATMVLPQAIGKQLGDFGISFTAGEVLSKTMERNGISDDEFSKAMAAVNVVARISKLIEIYSSLSVEVKVVGDNPVHKPLDDEPDLEVEFDAKVGVKDEDWKDYQEKYGELGTAADRIGRDCLSTLGIPTLANTGDIAKAVEGFAVEWRITSGSPDHAYDSVAELQDQNCSYHLGRLRCTLRSVSDHSAKSSFRVDVIQSKPPETQAVHESGVLKSAGVKVCASVDASDAPSLSTFINGAMGGVGIADPIAELAGGMILKLGKPKGCATLEVTWHVQKGWKVDETFSGGGVEDHFTGLSCGSPYGPWEIKEEGTFQGGTNYGSVNIPFSEDGKATATFEAHVRAKSILSGADTSGISNVVIIPNSGGYQINFGTFEMPGTCWGPDVSIPCVHPAITGLVFNIIPAESGQCSQPLGYLGIRTGPTPLSPEPGVTAMTLSTGKGLTRSTTHPEIQAAPVLRWTRSTPASRSSTSLKHAKVSPWVPRISGPDQGSFCTLLEKEFRKDQR